MGYIVDAIHPLEVEGFVRSPDTTFCSRHDLMAQGPVHNISCLTESWSAPAGCEDKRVKASQSSSCPQYRLAHIVGVPV